jgi:hypothetical protein
VRRQDPHEVPNLLKRYATLESRVRSLELRPVPVSTGGAGAPSGAWCLLSNNRDWVDGTVGFYAQMADMTPWDQSGGFSLVDPQTLALPAGLYVIEWTFTFEFFFANPYGSGFFGNGWTTWRGGAVGVPGAVASFGGDHMVAPVTFTDYGGGDASVQQLVGGSVFKWTGIVKAGGFDGSLLSLGILEFSDMFKSALDYANDFTEIGQPASTGFGRQDVWIASVGS